MKPEKKVVTGDRSVDNAEEKLSVRYPTVIRERLKERNSFSWGAFDFFCVFDEEDKFHTFDDVARENENPEAGWKKYLPEGFVAIADDGGQGCLALNVAKDGKVYYWDNKKGEISVFAEDEKILKAKLDEQDRT